MARDLSIKKVLVIGSGPIIIGQAAEFDYAGTQACRALREEGVEVVLINSNPATIMTDGDIADKVYIEPLTVPVVKKLIMEEKPDSILPTLGGQNALNIAMALADEGFLEEHNVRTIGTNTDTIKLAEDRLEFKNLMERINEPCAASIVVNHVNDALEFAEKIGYPVVVRPAYTLGGTGGGIANNEKELHDICSNGLRLSRVSQCLIERCIAGWKEIEYEVMRDSAGNCITVCNMENLDPVGVHTGDSIVVAPSQTLSDKEYQMLRSSALNIITALNIEGGCNVQYALNPNSFEYCVIEVNPRVSRSSALASKATGYPIAKLAAKIALGYTLDEIKNAVTGKTYASYEPTLDYVVCKIPKWPFDKFVDASRKLGTQMKATGEVMSICNNFEGALMKALRSLEQNVFYLHLDAFTKLSHDELKQKLKDVDDQRIFAVAESLRKGITEQEIHEITKIDVWFIDKIKHLVEMEERIKTEELTVDLLKQAKRLQFPDRVIAELTGKTEQEIHQMRKDNNIVAAYKVVDTCAAEFDAQTPYYYSIQGGVNEVEPQREKKKIMVLGSGPIRIGQGIEFDYCSVHCVWALKAAGYDTIIVNNNPETVSTDFDIADRLYFEPLTAEDVESIVDIEKPDGAIVQFGGQTAIKLTKALTDMGVKILGTDADDVDAAEDRERFDEILEKCHIDRPRGSTVFTAEEAIEVANKLGYPVLVRPSYVLGGRGMEVVYDDESLKQYMAAAVGVTPDRPILIDRFLNDAMECEADAISDGENVFVPAVMEHIELAGIHSGDSACILPSKHIPVRHVQTIKEYTKKIAREMNVRGLMNMQYAIADDKVYVLEANPRASRTVPLVSKVCNINMVKLATDIVTRELTGRPSPVKDLKDRKIPHIGVKQAVFPFNMFPEVDPILGPEMRSTGEVLGLANSYGAAIFKAEEATQTKLPTSGRVLISVSDRDKKDVVALARKYYDAGFEIVATGKTFELINSNNIPAIKIKKIKEGRPNIADALTNGELDMVINTPHGKESAHDDSYIRKTAIKMKIPYMTNIAAANAAVEGILEAEIHGTHEVKSLQEYHKAIKD